MINQFQFFTFFQVALYIFFKCLQIPDKYLFLVCVIVLVNSIHGTYLIQKYAGAVGIQYQASQSLIFLCDILSHWVVGLYMVSVLVYTPQLSQSDGAVNLLLGLIGPVLYLLLFSPHITYAFTGMSSLTLIKNHMLLLVVTLIGLWMSSWIS